MSNTTNPLQEQDHRRSIKATIHPYRHSQPSARPSGTPPTSVHPVFPTLATITLTSPPPMQAFLPSPRFLHLILIKLNDLRRAHTIPDGGLEEC